MDEEMGMVDCEVGCCKDCACSGDVLNLSRSPLLGTDEEREGAPGAEEVSGNGCALSGNILKLSLRWSSAMLVNLVFTLLNPDFSRQRSQVLYRVDRQGLPHLEQNTGASLEMEAILQMHNSVVRPRQAQIEPAK